MENAVGALRILEEAAQTPSSMSAALEVAARAFGIKRIGFFDATRLNLPLVSEDALEDIAAYGEQSWAFADDRVRYCNAAPIGKIVRDHIAVPPEVRKTSAIYNEFYIPRDLAWKAGWKFSLGNETWAVTLLRSKRQGAFDDAATRKIARFAPSLNRIVTMAGITRAAHDRGLIHGLTLSSTPSIVLDHRGRPSFVSEGAAVLFDATFNIKRSQLWAQDSTSNSGLRFMANVARGVIEPDTPQNLTIRRGDGRRPILASPMRVRGSGLDTLPGARLIIFLVDMEAREAPLTKGLQKLFGLSVAEAEIAALLSEGLSATQIAHRRNASLGTVRVQLKHLFRKLDVGRQSDVVRLVAKLRPDD